MRSYKQAANVNLEKSSNPFGDVSGKIIVCLFSVRVGRNYPGKYSNKKKGYYFILFYFCLLYSLPIASAVYIKVPLALLLTSLTETATG